LSSKEIREYVLAFGHENIQAVHPSTLMFTKEKHLSKTGDCVVAVSSTKSVADLSQPFKDRLKKPSSRLTILIEAAGITQHISASGSPRLILTHPTDIVIRKSDYISDRTVAIHAGKSANDLPRKFVEKLKNPQQRVNITLIVLG
jgi:hypothetical protein